MFEDMMLRRTFLRKRQKVTITQRELYDEELHKYHSSPDVGVISRCMRRMKRVVHMREE
jgi:hypothetical protein